MSIISRALSISLSAGLLILILFLIMNKKLKEKYALIWLATGFVILILSVFKSVLLGLTKMFGIVMPINAMFFMGIFFLILVNLQFSIVISNLCEQNKKIVQKLALLEDEYRKKE